MPPLGYTGESDGLTEGAHPSVRPSTVKPFFLLRTLRLILDCIDLRRDGILIS